MAILRQATVGASLWKFSGLLDRSKSQRLVTVPRYDRSQIDLNPGGLSSLGLCTSLSRFHRPLVTAKFAENLFHALG
jgi:hypothetical protein